MRPRVLATHPPPWRERLFIGREQAAQIEYDHEVLAAAADPPDVIGAPFRADIRRWFQPAIVELGNLVDAIRDEAEHELLATEGNFQHHDACAVGDRRRGQPTFHLQIDHRNIAAADVDQPSEISGRSNT